MREDTLKIGITHGDINGIGYEVILKTLLDHRIFEFCTPILYGSPKIAAYHRKALDINNLSLNIIKSPAEAIGKRANVINCTDDEIRVELGKSTPAAGEASYQALSRAVQDLKGNRIHALVTAPINKYNIQSANFNFAGHTEYLKDYFNADNVLMLMLSDVLKIGVVTAHVPIKDVPSLLSTDLILSKLRLLNKSLMEDFRIRKPIIAVLGFNPHAGEEGMLGSEEKEIIIPAINSAKEEKIIAVGPFATDGFFGSGEFKKFDATLAMYHDQGLAPFKAIVFDQGVNFTAGLPVVRTSPAHGTAFDLAGKNLASNDSFRNALYAACDIYHNRIAEAELSSNPLTLPDLSELL
jgi:4-hydroxythreonine-4-phosphate dehydrogenase